MTAPLETPSAGFGAAPADVDRFAQDLQARIGARLRHERGIRPEDLRALADSELQRQFDIEERRRIDRGAPPLGNEAELHIALAVTDRLFSYGPLQPFLDPGSGVSEINLIGCDAVWVTYVDGARERVPALFEADRDLVAWVERRARESGTHEYLWDFAHPILEMDLPNGDRLSAIREVAPRPVVAIRRHDLVTLATLDDLFSVGMVDAWARDFLAAAVRAKRNIVVSGGTSAGKTTVARALGNAIPRGERVVTVEDVAELRLEFFPDLHDQVVPLRRRPPNSDDRGEIPESTLAWAAQRQNADRVITGEVRGGVQIIPALMTMLLGNDGSMFTIHATSSDAALRKCQSYASIAPERWPHEESAWVIRDAVHLVVHVEFDRVANRRYVSSIRVVDGVQGNLVLTSEIYGRRPDGALGPTGGLDDALLADLRRAGYAAADEAA
ncbi:MAG: pilus assembly protein CpaF [Acidimicrobiaceae bacterium]|nr:pilus assembly protein CpaF [Acidimicrobiaceae bacterium]